MKVFLSIIMPVLLIILIGLNPTQSKSATLSDLKHELRQMVAELDVNRSYFSDSTATIWLNLAMDRIVRLGGFIPRQYTVAFDTAQKTISLPLDEVVVVTKVMAQSQKEWMDIPFVRSDSLNILTFRFRWTDNPSSGIDTPQILIVSGGLLPATQSFALAAGTYLYKLNEDFENLKSVYIYSQNTWLPCLPNPGLVLDTNVPTFALEWQDPDTALIFLRYNDLFSGDSLKIFYQRMLDHGDSISIEYLATAEPLDTNTDSLQSPQDLEQFIVAEAFVLYLQSQRRFTEALNFQAAIRRDMGITVNEDRQ